MATELKTQPTDQSVEAYLNAIENESSRQDCFKIAEIMARITQKPAVMWGENIVGYDSYHYKYSSGREADWMVTGFSPRKQNLTLYIISGFDGQEELLAKLGKHKTSVSCLYIKKLADVDMAILEQIIEESYKKMKLKYA